jgi:hypothetical protein
MSHNVPHYTHHMLIMLLPLFTCQIHIRAQFSFLVLDGPLWIPFFQEMKYIFLKSYPNASAEPSLTRVLEHSILYFTDTSNIFFEDQQ